MVSKNAIAKILGDYRNLLDRGRPDQAGGMDRCGRGGKMVGVLNRARSIEPSIEPAQSSPQSSLFNRACGCPRSNPRASRENCGCPQSGLLNRASPQSSPWVSSEPSQSPQWVSSIEPPQSSLFQSSPWVSSEPSVGVLNRAGKWWVSSIKPLNRAGKWWVSSIKPENCGCPQSSLSIEPSPWVSSIKPSSIKPSRARGCPPSSRPPSSRPPSIRAGPGLRKRSACRRSW